MQTQVLKIGLYVHQPGHALTLTSTWTKTLVLWYVINNKTNTKKYWHLENSELDYTTRSENNCDNISTLLKSRCQMELIKYFFSLYRITILGSSPKLLESLESKNIVPSKLKDEFQVLFYFCSLFLTTFVHSVLYKMHVLSLPRFVN